MECHQHDYHTFIPPAGECIHALCRRCGHVLRDIGKGESNEIPFVADKVKKETS